MCMAAVGLIGSFVSAAGAMQQANAQAAEYKFRAKLDKRQATLERMKGAYEANRMRDKGERVYGTQRAAFSEAGVQLEGSPVDTIVDSRKENELDIQATLWGQEIAGQNYDLSSAMNRMNAKQAKKAGVFAALSPVLSGFSQLAGAYS